MDGGGSVLDPLMAGEGRDGIDAMIQSVQAQISGVSLPLHERNRRAPRPGALLLGAGTEGGVPLAGGLDVGVIADGRLRSITGFLDYAPSPDGQ